jgi:serine/threonine protein kinase
MRFVHSHNAAHRDLTPANILIDKRGRPLIGDLGSSRLCDLSLMLTSQVGTPLYNLRTLAVVGASVCPKA